MSGSQAGTCANRCARGAAHRGSRRIAPAATRHARGRSARRPPPSAGAPAADHAAALWQLCCRIGRATTVACQVADSRARYHRLQRATGAGRGGWCERRNGTAGGRWGPRLPSQPASCLYLHALLRAAFSNFDRDRRGLWVRHADTHAQSNTPRVRGRTVHRSPSIGARTGAPERNTGCVGISSADSSRLRSVIDGCRLLESRCRPAAPGMCALIGYRRGPGGHHRQATYGSSSACSSSCHVLQPDVLRSLRR